MDVRDHAPDPPASLPVVTEDARLVERRALDEHRKREVRDALALLAEVYEVEGAVEAGDLDTLAAAIPDDGDAAAKFDRLRARYEREHPSLVHLAFETDAPVAFDPGQFLSVRHEEVTRPYSVASAPGDERVEFAIRRVPGGDLSGELCDLPEGASVSLRGPHGELGLQPPSGRDLAFLATGTGVAPFRSMIRHLYATGADRHEGTERDVWLFLGASWRDDLPYHEEWRALADERANFHYVPCCTREEYLTEWTGESCYVQHALAKHLARGTVDGAALPEGARAAVAEPVRSGVEARIDPGALDVYACGVSAMAYGLLDTVEAVGVPEARIDVEGYG